MRNLNNKDLFKIMRILRKANIKQELIKMKLPKDISDNEYGMMMLLTLLENAPQVEKEVFEFLADVGGVSAEELENDEFDLLPKIIKHLQGQKKLINFLSQAFKSVN